MKKLVLLDGMAITYRAYYALNGAPRTNSKGMNTGAVLGFTMTLYDLVKKLRPTHMAVNGASLISSKSSPPSISPSSPAKVIRPTMSLAPPPIGPTSRASTRS